MEFYVIAAIICFVVLAIQRRRITKDIKAKNDFLNRTEFRKSIEQQILVTFENICDSSGTVINQIKKTTSWGKDCYTVYSPTGDKEIWSIKQRRWSSACYDVTDASGVRIGTLKKMKIINNREITVGKIEKVNAALHVLTDGATGEKYAIYSWNHNEALDSKNDSTNYSWKISFLRKNTIDTRLATAVVIVHRYELYHALYVR